MPLNQDKLQRILLKLAPLRRAGDNVESRRRLDALLTELDALYWEFTAAELCQGVRFKQEALEVDGRARAIINSGLLSEDAIPDAGPDFAGEVFRQTRTVASPGVYYLCEWAQRSMQNFVLLNFNREFRERGKAAAYRMLQDADVIRLKDMRAKLLAGIAPLFANLPGVTAPVSEILASGKLDEQIDVLTIERAIDAAAAAEDKAGQLLRLVELRARIDGIARARAAAAQLKVLDAIGGLRAQISDRLRAGAVEQDRRERQAADEEYDHKVFEAKKDFLRLLIPALRHAVRLGGNDAGLRVVHSVLHTAEPRTDDIEVRRIAGLVEEYDPRLPDMPDFVIAPFRGIGFYEWDYNAIFVPLVSIRPADESIVHAIASYRLMEDALSRKYALIGPYKKRYGARDFRNRFIRDYRNWILGVGNGVRGAMDDETYQFFKKHIGPNPEEGILPRDVRGMDRDTINEEVHQLRRLLAKDPGLAVDRERLVALLWAAGRVQLAYENLKLLYRSMPANGKVALSLGLLCQRLSLRDEARQALRRCVENAPQSLWQVYATEALGEL